jgi:hypothetical protein
MLQHYVFRRDCVEQLFSQSEFNVDKMDGTGPSGSSIDFSAGNIFRINFSWYGYGFIKFYVQGTTLDGVQTILPMHVFQTIGQTSTMTPILPIAIEVMNGASAYVAGRQFSLLGNTTPINRKNSWTLTNISCTTTLTPIFSLCQKPNYYGLKCVLNCVRASANENTYIELRSTNSILNPDSLTGASFDEIPNAESCMQYDTSATASSDGTLIWSTIIDGNSCLVESDIDNVPITMQVTLSAQALVSTSTISYLHITWLEQW